jgi:CheY-like chemotaxis protein
MQEQAVAVAPPVKPYLVYAEDNPTDSLFFKRAFAAAHPDQCLVHHENGALAKSYLLDLAHRRNPLPSLVILDNKMPGLSGLDVLSFIRRHPRLRRLPVILLSASEEQRDLDRAYDQGVSAYLVKPNRYHQLKELIRSMATFWLKYNRVHHE